MVGIFNDLWLLVICHTILHEFLIFHSDKQVLKASCDKMDENDVQPGNEVVILSGKKETISGEREKNRGPIQKGLLSLERFR